MSEVKFPKAQQLHDAEINAWKYVFKCLTDLEERVKTVEKKLQAISWSNYKKS